MADKPVPVTMGSPRFTQREVRRFLVTHAWFPPGATLHAHVHERPTFAVLLDGAFDLVFSSPAIRRSTLACPPGTIFTEPAGERHANVVSEAGASVIVFQPDPEAPELDLRGLAVLDRINHFRHGATADVARELAGEVFRTDPASDLAIEALALEMLVEAARLEEDRRRPGEMPPWMVRAVEFVHAGFRDSPRIRDVAREAGVHPSHLAATFRRMHGVPLGRYIRNLRVRWAAERLAGSDEGIARIAVRAGFADQPHLTRAFKAHTGMTPGQYRERGRTPNRTVSERAAADRARSDPALRDRRSADGTPPDRGSPDRMRPTRTSPDDEDGRESDRLPPA